MNRSPRAWLPVIVILALMVILSIIGQYAAAISLVVALLIELESLGLFGEKEESKEESKENRKKEIQRQLTEVFSPIHFAVMRLSQHINLENCANPAYPMIGALIPAQTIDNWNKVAEILTIHAHDIGDERFQKWLTFRLVRDAGGNLCIGIDRYWAKWFLSLEADYQKLNKELAELTP